MKEQDKSEITELHEHHRIHVDPNQTPLRIDKFLMTRIEKVTRNKVQRAIKNHAVLVNGKEIKSNYKVRPLDEIVVVFPHEPSEKTWAEPEPMELDIIHEDDEIIVLNKPVGLVVHPGIGNYTGTLVNGLLHHLKGSRPPAMEGNDQSRPGLVHRIDKNTSGLMVIGKTENAIAHLGKQFFDHSIHREYQALVWGSFDEPKGTIEANIGRHLKDRLKQQVFPEGDFGKHAITHYETIEDLYYVSLVKCKLETGRTHQIRVHMAHTGHPLFNDEKYGGNMVRKGTVFTKYKQFVLNTFKEIPRHALHAKKLGFIHPATSKLVEFDSDLPVDMTAALEKWRHYVSHRKSKI